MSFLRINKFPISVTGDNTSEGRNEIGKRTRGFGGRPSIERRAIFRKWAGSTIPLAEPDALAQLGAIQGLGEAWAFDSDLFSGGGADSGGTVADIRRGIGADGSPVVSVLTNLAGSIYGAGVLAPAAAFTNVLPADSRDAENAPTGFTAVGGSTIVAETGIFFQGVKSLKVGTVGAGTGAKTGDAAISGTTIYRGFAHVFATSAIAMSFKLIDNLGTVATRNFTSVANSWVRVDTAGVTGGGATTAHVEVTIVGATPGIFYMDACQITIGNLDVAWADGANTGLIDLAYNADFLTRTSDMSIAFWLGVQGNAGSDGHIVSARAAGGTHEIRIFTVSGGDNLTVEAIDGDAVTATLTEVNTLGIGWIHVVVTWRRRNTDDESELRMYIDATEIASSPDTANGEFNQTKLDTIEVGHRLSADILNGSLDDLIILPYAMTAAQVTALFSMGKAMSPLPLVYIDGDLIEDEDLTVLALGKTDQAQYVSATVPDPLNNNAGTHRKNLRAFNFVLDEWGRE